MDWSALRWYSFGLWGLGVVLEDVIPARYTQRQKSYTGMEIGVLGKAGLEEYGYMEMS